MKQTRVWVEKELLNNLKDAFTETKGMTYSGLVDWALRYLLTTLRRVENE